MAYNYRKIYFDNHPGIAGKYQCVHCKRWFKKEDITIDHIIPQSKLKYLPIKDVLINLQPMCRSCNSSKGNRMQDTNIAQDLAVNIIKTGITKLFK